MRPMTQQRSAGVADIRSSPVSATTAGAAGAQPALQQDWRGVQEELQERFSEVRSAGVVLRTIECAIALSVLLISFPVLVFVWIVVRLDSPGPALFRQPRVGAGGRLFRFTKFRTLFADARERFPDLYQYRYSAAELDSLCFKRPNDPRVTRAGSWLRKSTLDELPNFWNVLIGDMALVGPRPEIPEMLPYYTHEEALKFSVRPGITGLAQISGRGRLNFRDTAGLDLKYVKTRSLRVDLTILLRTVWMILIRDGAF